MHRNLYKYRIWHSPHAHVTFDQSLGTRLGLEMRLAMLLVIILYTVWFFLSHAVLNASHNSISLCGEVGHLKSKVQHWARMFVVVVVVVVVSMHTPLISVCSLCYCEGSGLYGLPNQWLVVLYHVCYWQQLMLC